MKKRKPTLITTPFPTLEEVAKVFKLTRTEAKAAIRLAKERVERVTKTKTKTKTKAKTKTMKKKQKMLKKPRGRH
jgi:arsenate reductase-like glutaredoxin family protein